jgi:hypothetical protein
MRRYAVAAMVALLYVAGSVWIVRRAGESYRHDLRQRREQLAASGARKADRQRPPLPPPSAPSRIRHDEIVEPAPAPPADAKSSLVAATKSASGEMRQTERAQIRTPVTDSRRNQQTAPAKAATPGTVAPRFVANRLLPVVHDPFWDDPALAKTWDIEGLTVDDERQIGHALNALVLRLNARLADDLWLSRLDAIADPLRKLVTRKDVEYSFSILNSDVANVFSHPGGSIYLSRKLLEMVGEEEDYVLEFAMAHEMAHVDQLHALQCLNARGVKAFQDGTLIKLYLLVIPLAYPDELELAADKSAFQAMKRLGRSNHDCLAFLRKLEALARREGFLAGRAGPVAEPEGMPKGSPIENHLRSHPAVRKRLENVKQLALTTSGSGVPQ